MAQIINSQSRAEMVNKPPEKFKGNTDYFKMWENLHPLFPCNPSNKYVILNE